MSLEEKVKHLEEIVKHLTGQDTNILYEQWKSANRGHEHWDGSKYICDPGYERNSAGICTLIPEPQPHECPQHQHWDDTLGKCVDDVVTPPPPTPQFPEQVGKLLYDSNINGKWNNGVDRVVKDKEGNIGPNGFGFYCAASGSPQAHIDGKGVLALITKPGFGRLYFAICNYDAAVYDEFNIVSGSVDNLSDKWRNEHQMGGACDHRPGGLGTHVSLTECGFKDEKCHNIQGKGSDQKLKKPLKNNTWYKSFYLFKDQPDGKVRKVRYIDYNDGNGWVKVNEIIETTFPMLSKGNKAAFLKQSEGWKRLNGSGEIRLRNMQVYEV